MIARDFDTGDYAAVLAEAAIDAAIAVQARQVPRETAALLAAADSCSAIVGVVGWIDLRADDIAAACAAADDPRIVGYRHIVQDEADPDFLLDPAFIHGVQVVAARGLTYDLLVRVDQLRTVPGFLGRVGAGRFVLDHAAKPDIASGAWQPWADRIAAVAAFPNVDCKISGLVTEADHTRWTEEEIEPYLSHALRCFGPDRLIWGSDWPVCLLAADYRRVLNLVESFVERHCPRARMGVFGGNAIRAYALEERLR